MKNDFRRPPPIAIAFSLFSGRTLEIHRPLAAPLVRIRPLFDSRQTQKQIVDNVIRTDSRCQNVIALEIGATTSAFNVFSLFFFILLPDRFDEAALRDVLLCN